MLLYHGSNMVIVDVDLRIYKPFKDFGRGFYLTTIESQARLMAFRTSRLYSGMPTVTTFSINENAIFNSSLIVKSFRSPTIEGARVCE